MSEVMDEEERLRRMQALQMADLGTARREYISTVDLPNKYSEVKLHQIEAIRASNIKGSVVNQIAEANKAKLDAWSNAWKEIGNDVDMEDLKPMMSGQSHRAQLCDNIRAKGGQEYGYNPDDHPKDAARGGQTPRGAKGHSRGGGVAGSRDRGGVLKTALSPKNTPSPRASGHYGHHVAESSRGQRRFLDPALNPDEDENIFSKRGKLGGVSTRPPFTKVERGSRGRGRAATVKTRRVIDPQANFESMLAGPSDFMAIARLQSAAAATVSPKKAQSAATQSATLSDEPKKKKIFKEQALALEDKGATAEKELEEGEILEEGTESQMDEDSGVTVVDEPQTKGPAVTEQTSSEPKAADPCAIQVVRLPSGKIRSETTDSGKQKIDKGFRSSLPKPLLVPDESILVDILRKSQPASRLASPTTIRHNGPSNSKGVETSILDSTPPAMTMTMPAQLPGSPTRENKGADGVNNVAMKGALDLLIAKLRNELGQVNQIIENSPKPVESTAIGAYLLGRKQQLEKEIEEAIEMESDIIMPLSALTLDDNSTPPQQPEDEASQVAMIDTHAPQEMANSPEIPTNVTKKAQEEPLIPGFAPSNAPSGPASVASQQASFSASYTPPIPTPTSSIFTTSTGDIIGDHLLPGRSLSGAKSDMVTPKMTAGSGSIRPFSTASNTPITEEPLFLPQAAVPVDPNPPINQLQTRATPNIPGNATTRQYLRYPPNLSELPSQPSNAPESVQPKFTFTAGPQQLPSASRQPTEQGGQANHPTTSATAPVQYPIAPSQSQNDAPQQSSEQAKPAEQGFFKFNFPNTSATFHYSGSLFHQQKEQAKPQAPSTKRPTAQRPPSVLSEAAAPKPVSNFNFPVTAATLQYSGALFKNNTQAPNSEAPTGQENRNPSVPNMACGDSNVSMLSAKSNKPLRASGLEDSKWSTPAGVPTAPRPARKKPEAPRPGTEPSVFVENMAKHGVTVSKVMADGPASTGSSARPKQTSSLSSSKWASYMS
ncbi:hypothetical protein AJ79_01779 [Helicocarpus griseus UAMH5409]|uniref:Uncharacterized protein n=1 Tax=Helicocarpus griseus UAMH5409 TaxID=1447875 RepID=A0A2B7Y6E4_9EURO|nr:hypothetical protein AJ79_01779 [Helicocarpus griseus UAMH5409]